MRKSTPITLSRLLGAREPLFSDALKRAEMSSRHSGVDVQLIADIYHHAAMMIKKLGLDLADATPEEIYYSLTGNLKEIELFASKMGIVGLIVDDEIISFNYDDVKQNQSKMFHERKIIHMQAALAEELVNRYTDHDLTHSGSIEEIFEHAGFKWEKKEKKK